ncbi:MAG: 50S ribosomal protein L23 [bacterium]|nr:50S ribosomal protein L23 [bacterium]
MPLLNKLFGKSKSAVGRVEAPKKPSFAKATEGKAEPVKKVADFKSDGILVSPLTTEKAMSGQSLNKYVFKVAPSANKIDIIKAISKIYNVKAVSANIINIPRKVRQVGKTKGFKSGYKKAIVTLTKGQSIEVK